ncbi:thioredoxin [Flavobacterium lutivivi]|nr:thioredoxin [Flavobacterium lutivivi]
MKNKLFLLVFFAVLLSNCKKEENQNGDKTVFESIEPKAFSEGLKSTPDAQLIDVRTPEEYNSKHIDNAVNIDINNSNFDTEIAKLDKSKPVFVYCLSGGRSKAAASKMQALGFSKIYELDGGMMKWNASGIETGNVSKEGMTKADFDKLVNSDQKVLVDFYAEWCGPCKKMAPYIEKISNEGKIKVIRIDVDQNETLATEMKVDALPTLVVFEKGKKIWENVGYLSEEDLRKNL